MPVAAQPTRTVRPARPSSAPSSPFSTGVSSAILQMVRSDSADLSMRQVAVLRCLATGDATQHTVRAMAAALNVSKPAVTRGVDRLSALGFASRKVDPADRRSVIVSMKPAGETWLRALEAA